MQNRSDIFQSWKYLSYVVEHGWKPRKGHLVKKLQKKIFLGEGFERWPKSCPIFTKIEKKWPQLRPNFFLKIYLESAKILYIMNIKIFFEYWLFTFSEKKIKFFKFFTLFSKIVYDEEKKFFRKFFFCFFWI